MIIGGAEREESTTKLACLGLEYLFELGVDEGVDPRTSVCDRPGQMHEEVGLRVRAVVGKVERYIHS